MCVTEGKEEMLEKAMYDNTLADARVCRQYKRRENNLHIHQEVQGQKDFLICT